MQEVYAASYRRLVGQLTVVTGDPVEAADAVMEAFARAVSSPRSFLAADNPEAWLHTVAATLTRTRTRWRRSHFFRDVRHPPVAETGGAPEPGFDAIVERARASRRRRRTTIASGLAGAVVVACIGAAVGSRPGEDTRPGSAHPTRTGHVPGRVDPGLPEGVRHLLTRDEADAWMVSAVGSAVAAFWQVRDRPFDPCRNAWTIRNGDEVIGDLIEADRRFVSTVPGGWFMDGQQGPPVLLAPDGDLEKVPNADIDGSPLLAGDTAVLTHDGSRLLRDGALIPMPEPADRLVVGNAYATPSGRLIAATADLDGWRVQATDDGRGWEQPVLGPPGAMNTWVGGSGDHVAVLFMGADLDGSVPVARMPVSADAGLTWTTTRGLGTHGAGRSRNPYSLAVTPSGTTYLTTGTEGLLRIDSDGNVLATPLSAADTSVYTSGDEVCVVTEAGDADALRCSTDDGASWAIQPVPGFG